MTLIQGQPDDLASLLDSASGPNGPDGADRARAALSAALIAYVRPDGVRLRTAAGLVTATRR